EGDDLRSEELRGSLRGRADVDDPRQAEGSQADHRGRTRARQRHQPDGCAEGEPRTVEAAGKEQEQGRGRGASGQGRSGWRPQDGCQGEEVTDHSGKVFGTYGAFSALPRRLVAKEAKRHAA